MKSKRTKLARPLGGWTAHRLKRVGSTCSIHALLRVLGIKIDKRKSCGRPCGKPDCPRRRKTHVSFWSWKPSEIYETLHNARRLYRTKVKELHPDRGGDGRAIAELTEAWRRVKNIFERRGYCLDDGLVRHD